MQHIAIIKQEERGINDVLDQKCLQIDGHVSGKEKTQKIQDQLKISKTNIEAIQKYLIMQDSKLLEIFRMSFLNTWTPFVDLVSRVGKNTKYMKSLIPLPAYQAFQTAFFSQKKDRIQFNDSVPYDLCLEIKQLGPTIENWYNFTEAVKRIFITLRDGRCYNAEIEKESIIVATQMKQSMDMQHVVYPQNAVQQWATAFKTVFRYKLVKALQTNGSFPEVSKLLEEDPEQLEQLLNSEIRKGEEQNQFINDQLKFISSFLNSDVVDKDQFKEAETIYKEIVDFNEKQKKDGSGTQ